MLKNSLKCIGCVILLNVIIIFFIIFFAVDIITYKNVSFQKHCKYAVVEGWLYDKDINSFIKNLNQYEKIFIIGDKIVRFKEYFPYDNFAMIMKDKLIKHKINENKLIVVDTNYTKNHTFNDYKYLKQNVDIDCLDIYTSQKHSNRTYFIAKKFFKNVYIFYRKDKNLQNLNWLNSSGSFKTVIMEVISNIYYVIKF